VDLDDARRLGAPVGSLTAALTDWLGDPTPAHAAEVTRTLRALR
jgi:hypothetical protein